MAVPRPRARGRPDAEPEPGERIEIVPWPLDELDAAVAECEDSKSLIALLWLAAELADRATLERLGADAGGLAQPQDCSAIGREYGPMATVETAPSSDTSPS